MGRIYKENKNFINKYISMLNNSKKKADGMFRSSSTIILNEGVLGKNAQTKRLTMQFDTSFSGDIVIEETGRNLFFCVREVETKRYIYSRDMDQHSYGEVALKVFKNSLSIYSTPEGFANELAKFIKQKDPSSDVDNLRYQDFIKNVRRDIYDKFLIDFPEVKSLIDVIKELMKADVEVYRNPTLFKSLKNLELMPVSYINDADGILYVPYTYPSSKYSTSNIYHKVYLSQQDELSSSYLKSYAKQSFNYTPFSDWTVFDVKSNLVDRKRYLSYNYGM